MQKEIENAEKQIEMYKLTSSASIDTESKDSLEIKIKEIKQEIRELEKHKHDLEIAKDPTDLKLNISDGELKVWAEKVPLTYQIQHITLPYRSVKSKN
jgi:tetrahydromethanopterin S-methyltransferase subunit B